MTHKRHIALIVVGLLLVPLITQAQSAREQLNQLVQQLQSRPDDNGLRERIIKLAIAINPPPAIPENARKSFIEGSTIAKAATDASGEAIAIASFEEALNIAPWWGDAYYNLAAAQELAGKLDNAEASLKLYILTGPNDKDSRDAQDHVYALAGKKKLAAQARATEAESASSAAASARAEEQAKRDYQQKLGFLEGPWNATTTFPSGTVQKYPVVVTVAGKDVRINNAKVDFELLRGIIAGDDYSSIQWITHTISGSLPDCPVNVTIDKSIPEITFNSGGVDQTTNTCVRNAGADTKLTR